MINDTEKKEFFPDGTPIDDWFYETRIPKLQELGVPYVLREHGIYDDGKIYTGEIQALIDEAAANGGGVIVVPPGTYLTGSLFFKQGVNLYVEAGGTLRGSDDIADYPICMTRIEGQTCPYFAALINVDGLNGFTMCGPGTIDGNGLRAWRAFWLRRQWRKGCTNKDEQRPRLVHISNSSYVTVAGLNLQNSHFWTNHIYMSHHIKYLNCRITSPTSGVKAPSTDAIDIDVCSDFLVKNCFMEVNDDAVVLKGGKGAWADTQPENGSNERIIVEDCTYGHGHSCLTCGSESVHNRNIILRRCQVERGAGLLWLKMRPDTPQIYEYITVEQVTGNFQRFLRIGSWRQFFDDGGRTDIPVSVAHHITMQDCECSCRTGFEVKAGGEDYELSDFTFRNLKLDTQVSGFEQEVFGDGFTAENVVITESPEE